MKMPRLIGAALLACGLLLTAACSAHNDAGNAASATANATAASGASATPASATSAQHDTFTEGSQYITLSLPKGTPAPTGPVTVVEVFSYACPHCAEFAPYMDRLRAALPRGAEVRYMPAVFYPEWMAAAQTFYAVRQMGMLDKVHDLIFKAHREHYPLNSLSDYAAFLARHGVNQQTFLADATNAITTAQMAADQRTEMGWNIDETPTLVVGRMSSDAKDATFVALMRNAKVSSLDEMEHVGVWMAEQVAAKH
ncbi:MAG: thiol:disulfide interchange protein DsbA/DsbL [Rhodanobacteraceae bacterium]|nr:MAG: thiol:disulfide interchange protein DsbA/DsbL [Rhodanobacteraceae bacterium]